MIERAKFFFKKYEKYVSPVTLIGGFIFDNLALRRIDVLFSNVILISYLLISAVSIAILNIHEARRGDRERSETLHFIVIFMMQFCLGGLFSASFLFYSKSGTLIGSWPFLIMLLVYVLGNEFLRKNYVRLGFQITVFFTALFSFLIFFLPVILGKMGDSIFLLSGISSLIICGLFVYMLSWVAPSRIHKAAPGLVLSIIGVFGIINALYFTNLIPPIPLALKEAGIYTSVKRLTDGTYEVTGDQQRWFNFFDPVQTIHIKQSDALYAFSAIFAPTNLATNVIHNWQYYDNSDKAWVSSTKVTLSITGGRDGGFRTYSVKDNFIPGRWRVNVETPRGQLIGRLTFEVIVI